MVDLEIFRVCHGIRFLANSHLLHARSCKIKIDRNLRDFKQIKILAEGKNLLLILKL